MGILNWCTGIYGSVLINRLKCTPIVVTMTSRTVIPSRRSLLGEVFVSIPLRIDLAGRYYTTIDSKVLKRSLESLIIEENTSIMTKTRRIIIPPRECTLGGVFVPSQWGIHPAGQYYPTTILVLRFSSDSDVEPISQSANNQRAP